jgi:hypothetical protein
MIQEKDNLFDEDNEIKIPFATWEDKETKKPFVGRQYRGIYVKKEIVPDRLNEKVPNAKQTLYTLAQARMKDKDKDWKDIEGGILKVPGRGSENPKVFPGMEICRFGVEVGFKFVEERKPSKPGFYKAKIIRTFKDPTNKIHQDVLDEFSGFNIEDEEKDVEDII